MSLRVVSTLQQLSGEDQTLPIFPTGCTVDTAHNDTLAPCCASVGSTPAQVDGIYGCPYNNAFPPAGNQSFGTCALNQGAGSSCAPPPRQNNAAAMPHVRWNTLSLCLVLAVILTSLLQS
ncbi:hypothetical protein C8F04DRAFT_1394401 [Mycena alexandri]|uniref:Uncharacterized protein n=1 Tax=Mycena alexandri TaxID=1745969 RepID=A0AAD6SYT8_9AGAR|nr:hypothetical protein C8F04DRAFT_1394401 [Mycena alexandri]